MSATKTKSVKRKSVDSSEQALKKLKVAKSADRPLPTKSALKGSKQSTAASTQLQQRTDSFEFDDEEDETLTADQTAALIAGYSSSEEEGDDQVDDGIAPNKLPAPPLQAQALEDAVASISNDISDAETTPGVVYIGRLPHGFYERQMRAYFSQFGEITHLMMPRNRKTGRSKHYAFVEFASSAVAEIVAKTMDKYLLFNHILRVQTIPREHVKEGMWKGEGKRKRPVPRNKLEGAQLRRGTDAAGWQRKVLKENKRRQSKAHQLKELGYAFEMPMVKSVSSAPALDTPTLERGAEQQLLEDMAHAADQQSTEIGLQPLIADTPAEKKVQKAKRSLVDNEIKQQSTKRTKSKK